MQLRTLALLGEPKFIHIQLTLRQTAITILAIIRAFLRSTMHVYWCYSAVRLAQHCKPYGLKFAILLCA